MAVATGMVAFPASLIVIEKNAFHYCEHLGEITFAAGSQLKYIRSEAFGESPLTNIVIPASIAEIDPSAFTGSVWQDYIRFEGVSPYLIDSNFIPSADSHALFRSFGWFCLDGSEMSIASNIEVIAANAFRYSFASSFLFKSDAQLREIGSGAFCGCPILKEFTVPESVEILGDRCFESCSEMQAIKFAGSSRLKRIGERAFMGCSLHSITIPALTEEIDGSAFMDCPLITIQVAPENPNFKVEGDLLVTSDGIEIVRYFGHDREIFVDKKVKVLRKSCFECCKDLDGLNFEIGSELGRIGRAALRSCESLSVIEIPASVPVLEECSFEGCTELESVSICQDSSLVTIGSIAFANCPSL
jgi:hypothetical protein